MFNPLTVAMRINAKLAETEELIATTQASMLGLTLAMVEARTVADIDPAKGQSILRRAQRAQQSLLSAQTDLFRVHADLRSLNDDVKMMPDENGECPGTSAMLSPVAMAA